jgi:hypothetical protein
MTIAAVALAAAFVAGGMLGWKLRAPKRVIETPAPAVVQPDGSLILERRPDPAARPQQQIPKGAVVERIDRVRVRSFVAATDPTPGSAPEAKDNPQPATPCPDVTVDLSLVRMPDQTRRVIASSPDGQIVGGLDVPVESAAVPVEQIHTVIAAYNFTTHDASAGYARRIFRIGRLSVDVGALAIWQDRKLSGQVLLLGRW